MRKILIAVMAMVTMFWLATPTHANLYDRGNGLIYDDVLKITWLQDANYAATNKFGMSGIGSGGLMNWDKAKDWIAAMNTAHYLGYSDWRLPTTVVGTAGYNITSSEMGYMYYINLANKGYYDTSWSSIPNATFTDGNGNTVSFQNLQPANYWSGTEYSSYTDWAWYFSFYYGNQDYYGKSMLHYAWAVRPGDVTPVPAPATMVLLGSGLAGLGLFRRVRRRHG